MTLQRSLKSAQSKGKKFTCNFLDPGKALVLSLYKEHRKAMQSFLSALLTQAQAQVCPSVPTYVDRW